MSNICRCRWFLQMLTRYGRHLYTPLLALPGPLRRRQASASTCLLVLQDKQYSMAHASKGKARTKARAHKGHSDKTLRQRHCRFCMSWVLRCPQDLDSRILLVASTNPPLGCICLRRVSFQKSSLFDCLFVVIRPENPCFASRPGLEVKPLGVYSLGPGSSSCGPTKGTTPFRNTLVVNIA